MYYDFTSTIGGSYPATTVIKLDTMEITYFAGGDISAAASAIQAILDEEQDPCSEL